MADKMFETRAVASKFIWGLGWFWHSNLSDCDILKIYDRRKYRIRYTSVIKMKVP